MLLVNIFVEKFVVKQSVWVVKADFVNQYTNDKVNDDFFEGRHFAEVFWEAFALLEVERYDRQRNADEYLVEQNHFDGVYENVLIYRFVCLRLNFVLSQSFGAQSKIHREVESTDEPVKAHRPYRGANNVHYERIFPGQVDDSVPALAPKVVRLKNPLKCAATIVLALIGNFNKNETRRITGLVHKR